MRMALWRRVPPEPSLKDKQEELTRRIGETQVSASRMKNANEQKHRVESSRFVYEE